MHFTNAAQKAFQHKGFLSDERTSGYSFPSTPLYITSYYIQII